MTVVNPVFNAVADDGTQDSEQLIAAYVEGPARIARAVEGFDDAQLRLRPVDGKWSRMEVVCHLSDCEQFFADRMKRTIATDLPLLLGAQGSLYPAPLFYQERDLAEELRLIEVTRAQMARILRRLQPEAWVRTAVHSEVGLLTLRQLVLHADRHVTLHLRHVDDKRRALGLAGL